MSRNAVINNKPKAYTSKENNWSTVGRLVEIKWKGLDKKFDPKDQLDLMVPLLPKKYSPIQINGRANQGNYLAYISDELGILLISLIRQSNPLIESYVLDFQTLNAEEEEVINVVEKITSPTFREALIKARVGQAPFRRSVEAIERKCRVTEIDETCYLIASHIKPWKNSSDDEKLDGQNGLMLAPHIDKLFDGGYISFSDSGKIILAHKSVQIAFHFWKLDQYKNVGSFNVKQRYYLQYHREVVLIARREKLE